MMGSGGMIVMDERTCMVDVARYFLNFLKEESCGKCTACREGVDRMHEILTQICDGNGKEGDIELLEEIGTVVKDFALCALGGTAPNPVLSTTKYFKEEYEAHIKYKKCPAVVCKKIISSPCQHVCPLGTDVPAYVTLIAKGEFEKALDVVRKTNPLPLICGRVCHHPCEQYCALGDGADPLAIKSLKRFLTDWELTNKGVYRISPSPIKYEKVAIIGSGPAGLTCAYMLRNLGYDTTIFEKTDVIGGMLALTIPDYRLPKNLLNMEIETIKSAGVNIKTNCEITNLDELFNQDFKAIFIATGAHKDLKLGIPGEDIKGVINALEFLKDVKSGKKVQVGDKVGIVGGGNTAIDAARTALRLGAKEVTILYRRTRAEMPAISEEVDSAIHEGINIKFLTAPTKIEAHNGKLRVECVKMQLGSIDASGRRRPIPIKGSEYAIELDTLIPAIGQQPQIPFAQQSGIKLARGNTIKVDPETLATDRQGVFAGGDVVSGPATVVEAIKAGTVAAESIHRFLRGQSLKREYHITKPSVDVEPIEFSDEEIEEILKTKRPSMPHIPREKRIFTFNEVDLGFTKEMAMKEATRCLRCDKMI
jgi:NADH-quinone oxidoreductase subunit F